MSAFLVVLSVCLFALVAGVSVKKQNLIQATPSLVWFSLMTLPFIFEWRFFPSSPRTAQSIGLFMISAALAVGDLISLKMKNGGIRELETLSSKYFRFFHFLIILVFVIPVFHYWKAGMLPIYDQYFGNLTKAQVALERENFGKLLQVPYLFKILVNWVSNIFGPLVIIWFFSRKKYWWAAGIFVWVLFYASASSADGPIVMFIWLIAFGITHKTFRLRSLGNLITSSVALGMVFIVVSGVTLGASAIARSTECSVTAALGFTPGDVLRSCDETSHISLNPVMDRLGYRFFLTPVEVSNRWYDYFDGNPSGHRNFSNILERRLPNQASNKVAIWAYVSKFPESYPKTTSANTSIDADAYSFYGLFSVLIVALIFLVIRVFVSFTSRKINEFESILEGLALGMLAFLPVTAPMQAILLPQGLGLILLILFLIRIQNIVFQIRFKIDKFQKFSSSSAKKQQR
jgi:hypothetical protein